MPDEERVTVRFSPLLAPDGSESWRVVSAIHGIIGFPRQSKHGGTIAGTDASKIVAGELDVAFDTIQDASRKVVIRGPFEAKGCGSKSPGTILPQRVRSPASA